MPAEIDTMFYTGEVPWHKEGTRLDQLATAKEAIEAAKLDWVVELEKVFFHPPKEGNSILLPDYVEIPNKFAVVRKDKNVALGIVGNVYQPLQNKEAFSFFDAVVREKMAIYETAGSLRGGQKIWILAKLPGNIKIAGQDVIDKYLLLHNSHDGTSAVQMMITPIRVVCMNTLNFALSDFAGAKNRGWIKHSNQMLAKVNEVREQLQLVNTWYERFSVVGQHLAKSHLTADGWLEFLNRVGVISDVDWNKLKTREQNILGELTTIFENGRGNDLPETKHTLWTAVNSIAEYTDHTKTVRVTKNFDSEGKARLNSQWFGSGYELKQKAWDTALEMVAQ